MALQQQRQHRHEMALAAVEATVRVSPFAGEGFEGALDQVRGLIEADDQLRCHYVGAQGIGGALDAFGQAQDEVSLMYLAGDVEDVADEGQSGTLPRRMEPPDYSLETFPFRHANASLSKNLSQKIPANILPV
jgi:hypothetical protein